MVLGLIVPSKSCAYVLYDLPCFYGLYIFFVPLRYNISIFVVENLI